MAKIENHWTTLIIPFGEGLGFRVNRVWEIRGGDTKFLGTMKLVISATRRSRVLGAQIVKMPEKLLMQLGIRRC